MRPPRAALLFALASAAGPRADAQTAPAAVVRRVERASADRARAALAAHLTGIARCVERARVVDPAPLARLRFIDATIRLARDGTSSAVELSPPPTSRGLSACLADELLDWDLGGPAGFRASVYLRIAVAASTP